MATITSTENLGTNPHAQSYMHETPVYADFTGNFRGYGDKFVPAADVMKGLCGVPDSVDSQTCEVYIRLRASVRNARNKGLSEPFSHDGALKKAAHGYIEGGTDFLELSWAHHVMENLQQWQRQAFILMKEYFSYLATRKG